MICWIDKWIWASYLAKFKTPFSLVVFIFEHGPWASMYWIICLPTPKRWETDYFSFFSTLNVELRTRSFCWNAHKSSVCMVWVFFSSAAASFLLFGKSTVRCVAPVTFYMHSDFGWKLPQFSLTLRQSLLIVANNQTNVVEHTIFFTWSSFMVMVNITNTHTISSNYTHHPESVLQAIEKVYSHWYRPAVSMKLPKAYEHSVLSTSVEKLQWNSMNGHWNGLELDKHSNV